MGFPANISAARLPAAAFAVALAVSPLRLRAQVTISEVLASSQSYRTAEGHVSDWLELHNASDRPADVSGWLLTDRPNASPPKWKPLPKGSVVPAGGYLLVWADGWSGTTTNGEVHVDLRLSRDGESLALADPSGAIVSRLDFPEQFPDVSYGFPRPPQPDGQDDWNAVTGLVGFAREPGVFTCTEYDMAEGLHDIGRAEACLADETKWARPPVSRTYPAICFREEGSGRGEADPFPGNASFRHERDNIAILAEGVVDIPDPGVWTFACCSDDGFRLTLTGLGETFTLEHPGARAYAPTLQCVSIGAPGPYAVRLVYF